MNAANPPKRRVILAIALFCIVLAGYASYRDTLGSFFTGTDALTQIETGRVRSVRDVIRIFSEPMMNNTTLVDRALWYRPTAILSYSLDYELWKLNPFGYHLTDLTLHVLVSVLMFFLLRSITGGIAAAWIGAVLFAIHPAHVENVPAIARRHDAIVMVFMFPALLVFMKSRRALRHRRTWLVASLVLYGAALGSKEIAPIFPALVAAYCLVFRSEKRGGRAVWKEALKWTTPYLVLTLVYVLWRARVLGGIGGETGQPNLFSSVEIVRSYARGLADPYGFVPQSIRGFVAPVFWLLAGTWAFMRFGHRRRGDFMPAGAESTGRALAFFVVWLMLPLAVLLATRTFTIRRLYVPAIPFCAIAAVAFVDSVRTAMWGLKQMRSRNAVAPAPTGLRGATAISLGMVLVTLGIFTTLFAHSPIVRSYEAWKAHGRFSRMFLGALSELVPALPTDARLHFSGLPLTWGRYMREKPHVETPWGIADYSIKSWLNLNHPENRMTVVLHERTSPDIPPTAVSLETTGRAAGNVEIHIGWTFPDTVSDVRDYLYLGKAHLDTGDAARALEYLRKYTDSAPSDPIGWLAAGEALAAAGDREAAVQALKESLRLNTDDNGEAFKALSTLYDRMNRHDDAYSLRKEWVERLPRDAAAYSAMGWADYSAHKYERAVGNFQRSLKLEQSSQAYLGLCLVHLNGLKDHEGVEFWSRAWLRFNRRAASAYAVLGLSQLSRGELEESISNLERSLEIGEAQATARRRTYAALGRAKAAAKDLPGALAVYLQAAAAFPGSTEFQYKIAGTYAELGDCGEAERYLGRAVALGIDPEQVRKIEEAIERCRKTAPGGRTP